jgi:hypothetical protein
MIERRGGSNCQGNGKEMAKLSQFGRHKLSQYCHNLVTINEQSLTRALSGSAHAGLPGI